MRVSSGSGLVRAAEADDEAPRVIALQRSVGRDDVGGGHLGHRDDAGGRPECASVARTAASSIGRLPDRHSVENPRLSACRASSATTAASSVYGLLLARPIGPSVIMQVDARTSTELQVKAIVSAGRWSARRAARPPTRAPPACPCAPAASARRAARVGVRAGAGAGGGAAPRTRVGRRAATGRSGRAKSGSISSHAASSNAVTVPPCAPGVNRKCATLSDRPAFQRHLHGPAAVLVAPGVPVGGVGVQTAGDQRRRHRLQQRQHRGAVGEHGVRRGCQLGRA